MGIVYLSKCLYAEIENAQLKGKLYADICRVVTLIESFSCNLVTRPQAIRMNNTLVHINDTLYLDGKEYGSLVDNAIKEKDYRQLIAYRIQFEKYIDSSRMRVANMQDAGGSEALRHCEIELLEIEKRMVGEDFQKFEHFTAETSMPEISAVYGVIKEDSKEEEGLLSKFKIIQGEYARKNGFVLRVNQ